MMGEDEPLGKTPEFLGFDPETASWNDILDSVRREKEMASRKPKSFVKSALESARESIGLSAQPSNIPSKAPVCLATSITYATRPNYHALARIDSRACQAPLTQAAITDMLDKPNVLGKVIRVLKPDGHNYEIAGYMIYELQKYQVELLSLAIDPIYQRHGLASLLIDDLFTKLSSYRYLLCVYVDICNLPMQVFLRSRCIRAKGCKVIRDRELVVFRKEYGELCSEVEVVD